MCLIAHHVNWDINHLSLSFSLSLCLSLSLSLPPEVSYYLGNDDFESLLNYESFNKLFPLDSSKPPPTNNHDNIVERLDPLIYYYTHTYTHTSA